ncbi:death domain-containing protein 1 isoform X1 [Astyanax mexicanus]|uniref:death domain-containing protein 1 isoform X1 n=2 Tax=Astyanax mexicanus TaxID=7994 RepID=UPI0020CB0B8A|nr:death domain-containing protein 1 isoform X1 [Astyanax mexicanus]
MLGEDFGFGSSPEDKLLSLLQDTTQKLQALLHSGTTISAEEPGPELAKEDSARLLKKLFQLFKDWSVLHTHRVRLLREELNVTAHTLTEQERKPNTTERDSQISTNIGVSRESNLHKHAYITDVILNVLEDVQNIEKKLHSVTSKLERAISVLSKTKLDFKEARQDNLVLPQTSSEQPCVPQELIPDDISTVSQECDLQSTPDPRKNRHHDLSDSSNECRIVPVRGVDAQKENNVQNDSELVKNAGTDVHKVHLEAVNDGEMTKEPVDEVIEERGNIEKSDKGGRPLMQSSDCVSQTQDLATVSLTDSGSSSSKPVCYITGPVKVAKLITCKVVDGLSSLMVSGSEELVSSVLRIEIPSSTKSPLFPLSIAMPFRASYRGYYREVTVKVVDQEQRVSYVSPIATESSYEGHRGSFAVVRVYTLGVFAVVSRLQRETFTIPKRGISVKLTVDPRICLDYSPGSFTTPVVAQAMVQPVDAILLNSLKSWNDSYRSILTTSPLLYLNHPSTLSFRRPVTITLPCPPNPDKRKTGEDNSHTRPNSKALRPDTFPPCQIRVLSASLKSSRELCKEQLAVLGWRDEQWNVLDQISVRNLQNGLVSFDLMDNCERLIVLRLLSSIRPPCLTFFAQDLEESVRTCAVTVVLHTKREDPSNAILAAHPSRDLSWALNEFRAQAYFGPPEPSTEFSMREGDQLLLKFSGNITSAAGDQGTAPHTVTLHIQRRNWLCLKLKEQDPFGNYSSPHYKGTAILFRIPRDQLVWRGDQAVISEDYKLEAPVCKLSLTLPKTVKTLNRPMSAKVLRHDQRELLCDELLAWLSGELSEEDAALLVMCLRLRRSTVQLARLRAPDSLSLQTFNILSTWRRSLPSSTPKRPLLARCLTHIGRPELAAELLRRGPAVDEGERKHVEPWRFKTLRRSVTSHGTLRQSITLE